MTMALSDNLAIILDFVAKLESYGTMIVRECRAHGCQLAISTSQGTMYFFQPFYLMSQGTIFDLQPNVLDSASVEMMSKLLHGKAIFVNADVSDLSINLIGEGFMIKIPIDKTPHEALNFVSNDGDFLVL
jgi:hypothetical protein